jgi:hypothetical protein
MRSSRRNSSLYLGPNPSGAVSTSLKTCLAALKKKAAWDDLPHSFIKAVDIGGGKQFGPTGAGEKGPSVTVPRMRLEPIAQPALDLS